MATFVVCGKCSKTAEIYEAEQKGWLIASREGKNPGYMIIRCPEHITQYARRQAGIKPASK